MFVKKGTLTFIVDENKELTNRSVSMDKDRELNIGDIFFFNEDHKNLTPIPMTVVAFADFMPCVIESEDEFPFCSN